MHSSSNLNPFGVFTIFEASQPSYEAEIIKLREKLEEAERLLEDRLSNDPQMSKFFASCTLLIFFFSDRLYQPCFYYILRLWVQISRG